MTKDLPFSRLKRTCGNKDYQSHRSARPELPDKTSRHSKNKPGGHLSAVFIANQSIRRRLVKVVHDLAHARLRLPWLVGVVVEIAM